MFSVKIIMSHLLSIDPYLILHIFEFVDGKTKVNMINVCRKLNNVFKFDVNFNNECAVDQIHTLNVPNIVKIKYKNVIYSGDDLKELLNLS